MAKENAPIEATIVALPQRKAMRAFAPVDPDVIERCFELWSTVCGRDATATAHAYAAELPEGEPAPAVRTVQEWARHHAWKQRADSDFAAHHGLELEQLQHLTLAAMKQGARNELLVALGAFDHNPMAGAVRLKASELTSRKIERGILPLVPKPAQQDIDEAGMSREEREAKASAAIARKKGA